MGVCSIVDVYMHMCACVCARARVCVCVRSCVYVRRFLPRPAGMPVFRTVHIHLLLSWVSPSINEGLEVGWVVCVRVCVHVYAVDAVCRPTRVVLGSPNISRKKLLYRNLPMFCVHHNSLVYFSPTLSCLFRPLHTTIDVSFLESFHLTST